MKTASVTQRIEYQPSKLEVAGSSPARGAELGNCPLDCPDRETWRGKADVLLDRLQLHSICGKVVRQKLRVRHRQCQINDTVLL